MSATPAPPIVKMMNYSAISLKEATIGGITFVGFRDNLEKLSTSQFKSLDGFPLPNLLLIGKICTNWILLRPVVWSLYIRLVPKVSDKRIQNLSLNCQSFPCFLFSLSQSLKEYSLPDDLPHKFILCQVSSKMPFKLFFYNSAHLQQLHFFLVWAKINPIFWKNATFVDLWK